MNASTCHPVQLTRNALLARNVAVERGDRRVDQLGHLVRSPYAIGPRRGQHGVPPRADRSFPMKAHFYVKDESLFGDF
jgi:hypothetical protein